MESKTVLIFAPEASVVPHFVSLCLVGRILKERGHRVVFARCQAVFPRCPVMDMYFLPFGHGAQNHQKVCVACTNASSGMLNEYGLESIDIQSFMRPELIERAVAAIQATRGGLLDFSFEGIEFGKMCLQDVVLTTKVSDLSRLDETAKVAWSTYVSSAVISYLVAGEMLDSMPAAHVFYHNDYSLNVAARLAAAKRNIPSTTIGFSAHLVQDRRRYNIQTGNNWRSAFQCTRNWSRYRGLALSPETVRIATDDILKRLGSSGGFVYSPAKTFDDSDLRTRLGLPPGRKLLAAFTSSIDERLASKYMREALKMSLPEPAQPFEDQADWLESMSAFAESREDVTLVVRVHPREGANKRDPVESQHLAVLKARFGRPYRNCRFIWPEDPLSSYDLGEAADLVLTSWSTIGIDLARLAVPVIHTTQGASPWPVDDFQEWVPTREAYFRRLEEMLRRPAALDPLLHAYRWYHLYVLGRSVDLGDVIPAPDHPRLPVYRTPAEAVTLEQCTLGGGDIQDVSLERLMDAQTKDSAADEERAVKREIRRVLHFLYTGEDAAGKDYRLLVAMPGDRPLEWAERAGLRGLPDDWAVVLAQGGTTWYIRGGRVRRRESPMGGRLARLAAHLIYAPEGLVPDRSQVVAREARLLELLRDPGFASRPGQGFPSPALHAAYARVVDLKEKGLVALARETAAGFTAEFPLCPDFPNLEGHLSAMLGDFDGALERFAFVSREWPGCAKARSNLGAMLWEKGDADAALEHLAAAQGLEPFNADYLLNAVKVHRAKGRSRDAKALCEAYLEGVPGDERILQAHAEL